MGEEWDGESLRHGHCSCQSPPPPPKILRHRLTYGGPGRAGDPPGDTPDRGQVLEEEQIPGLTVQCSSVLPRIRSLAHLAGSPSKLLGPDPGRCPSLFSQPLTPRDLSAFPPGGSAGRPNDGALVPGEAPPGPPGADWPVSSSCPSSPSSSIQRQAVVRLQPPSSCLLGCHLGYCSPTRGLVRSSPTKAHSGSRGACTPAGLRRARSLHAFLALRASLAFFSPPFLS